MVRRRMAEAVRRSDGWIWALVIAATGSVLVLAVAQERRRDSQLANLAAPALSLPQLGGGEAALPKGKVTMVDFWATWCAPCRVSMPRLQRLWQEYKPSGVEIYSVDTDDASADREAEVREFLLKNGLTFPVVLDDGRASEAFSVKSLPTLLLLDKQGKVAWSFVGALNAPGEAELRAAIDQALAEKK